MLAHRIFLVIVLALGMSAGTSLAALASVDEYRAEERDRKFAHAQHEIILLLIKDGDFDKAWEETQELLEVRMVSDGEQEMMVRSLTIISEKFFQKGRVDLSYQILDKATLILTNHNCLSHIYLNQARLYKTQGLNHKAIAAYKKYQELSGK